MCGIIGYATKKPSGKMATFMAQGLYIDTLRGECGTGIYAVTTDRERHVLKRALSGYDFINSRQFDIFKDMVPSVTLAIGHNRASTIGSARDSNCHPFVYDHIGLVHNGTLRNYYRLVKEDRWTHPVDSAYAAKGMAESGEKETLEKTTGPFVFVWHNNKDNTLNIARNGNRDICYVVADDGDTLLFASEIGMLGFLVDRLGINIGKSKFYQPREYTHYIWDLSRPNFSKPTPVAFEEYKEPVSEPSSWRRNSYISAEDRAFCEKWNVKYDDKVDLKFSSFEPYAGYREDNPNITRGRLVGEIHAPGTKKHGAPIIIHGKLRKEAIDWIAHGWGHGVVSTCWTDNYNARNNEIKAFSINHESLAKLDGDVPVLLNQATSVDGPSTKDKSTNPPVVQEPVLYLGPRNYLLSRRQFEDYCREGCGWCSGPVLPENHEDTGWLSWGGEEDMPLCPACVANSETLTEIKGLGGVLVLPGDSDTYLTAGYGVWE